MLDTFFSLHFAHKFNFERFIQAKKLSDSMRITALFLLPALALSFAPQQQVARAPTKLTGNVVDDLCDDIVSKTESVVERVDSLVLKRAMRLVNHFPMYYTLKGFASAAGSSMFGVDAAASAFSYSTPALLALPTWTGNVWRVACLFQVASLAKSALASDSDELSQSDITSMAATNFAATKALTSGSLQWLVATSVLSSYSARNGASSDLSIHNGAIQLVSSFTTATAILGITAAVPSIIPVLAGQEEILALIGLGGMYAAGTRSGNGQVKKVVNGLVAGGILWSKIAGGALNVNNLLNLGTVITAGTAFVAYEVLTRAKNALAD